MQLASAQQVIKAALQRILVQASEADLEADEYQDAIFALNNWMTGLEAEGVNLGYTVVSDLGDSITVPTGALRGMIANLAVEVAPDYGGSVSPVLLKAADEGLKQMRLIGQNMGATEYPSILPRGSGNEGDGHQRQSHYYDELESTILAETTGAIGLESGT